jgi:isopenicillin N synthase-like dioxygenase
MTVVVRVRSTLPASSMTSAPKEDRFEQVVQDLERRGTAVLELPRQSQAIIVHQTAFATAKHAFHLLAAAPSSVHCQRIGPGEDSAHATGYHTAGGMSRYNACREGFVVSDGASFGLGLEPCIPAFERDLQDLSESMHGIAQQVLSTMERSWDLPEHWFQTTLGDAKQHSQWHMKRYVRPEREPEPEKSMVEDIVLLPSHTDPSLISIIVHDAPNMQDGCMGLQYQGPPSGGKREWIEVPKHGHLVATVMVGSVLGYITGGRIPPAKHRVIATAMTGERLVATLFVRPRSTAMLQVPPSIVFQNVSLKKQVTFDTWNARVSRNYMKGKVPSFAVQERQGHNLGKEKETACDQKPLDYFCDDYTELSLLHSDPVSTGLHQFNGGVLATSNGKIYTIPGHAPQLLLIDPQVEPPTIQPMGPVMPGTHKWRNGVSSLSTGIIYAIPCHADHLLAIHPETNVVSAVAWDDTDECAPAVGMPWKWHGGCISNFDACLYCIPDCAEHVLKMDPRTERVTFLTSERLEGQHKFCGGLLGTDGAIYGIPRNARGVLRIDPVTQSMSIHGTFPEGGNKWNGGMMTPNGTIYGIPAHANSVLKIVPGNPPDISTIGGPWSSGDDLLLGDNRYLGGVMGNDGNIYLIPSNADYVLQVNPKTDIVRQIGPNLKSLEHVHGNKWQNGFCAPDGAIYGIPLNSISILRIRPGDGKHPDVTTIGGPYQGLNKWAGGVLSKSGAMYCIPQNHSMILRMKPVVQKSNGEKLDL